MWRTKRSAPWTSVSGFAATRLAAVAVLALGAGLLARPSWSAFSATTANGTNTFATAADWNLAPTASFTATAASASPPTQMAVGEDHVCALLGGGAVKCWGYNASGQLGLGDTANRGDGAGEMGNGLPTVDLGTSRSAVQVVAGTNHSCALLDDGTVKCWGLNASGQLGQGDTANRGDAAGEMGDGLAAVDLGTGRKAAAISVRGDFSCALLDTDSVKCWGDNTYGQLGQGDTNHRGDAASELGDSLSSVSLGTGRSATAISAGGFHVCAVLDDATLKCWGRNYAGQLGIESTSNRGDGAGEMGDSLPTVSLGTGRTAADVAGGQNHTCAVLDDDSAKCWGRNTDGQLGLGATDHRGDAAGEMGDNLAAINFGSGRSVASVATGGNNSCALLDNATVKCWGYGTSGGLGYGDTNHRGDATGEMGDNLPAVDLGTGRSVLRLAGGKPMCAWLDDASLKCWGLNSSGQLGIGSSSNRGDGAGEMGDNLPAVSVAPLAAVTQVAVNESHMCALFVGGVVKCWGANSSGKLGRGDTSAQGNNPGEMGGVLRTVRLGTGRSALQVVVGAGHSCARLDDGSVKCWGANTYGQLGLGATARRGDGAGEMGDDLPAVSLGTGRTAAALHAAGDWTCVVLDDATVKCWGYNAYGQLGLGDTSHRGDGAGEMGDSLPAVSLGTGRSAADMTTGRDHACALLDNGALKCWGRNTSGQLGLGDTGHRGDGAGEMGDSLATVDLGTGRSALTVVAGADHVCALLDNAALKCWGSSYYGQLGYGDTSTRGNGGGEMGDNLPAVDLGAGRAAAKVVTTGNNNCALLDNAAVKCWGYGTSGGLGYGDTNHRGDGAGEMGDSLPAVALGTGRTADELWGGKPMCAGLDNATLKCWGLNASGQLGYGDTDYRGDGAGEMGDDLPAVALDNLTVVVDASASSDPDGSIVSYAWSFGDSQVGSGVKAFNTYTSEGTWTIALVVTDDDAATGSANTNVTNPDP